MKWATMICLLCLTAEGDDRLLEKPNPPAEIRVSGNVRYYLPTSKNWNEIFHSICDEEGSPGLYTPDFVPIFGDHYDTNGCLVCSVYKFGMWGEYSYLRTIVVSNAPKFEIFAHPISEDPRSNALWSRALPPLWVRKSGTVFVDGQDAELFDVGVRDTNSNAVTQHILSLYGYGTNHPALKH